MKTTLRSLGLIAGLAAALCFGESSHASIEFEISIDGSQSVPPVDTPGTGTGTATLDPSTNELSWNISHQDLIGEITFAHFHGPASPGEEAGVQVNIGAISGLDSPMIGSTTVSQDQADDPVDGLWYVNIHSSEFPLGEIRGQVINVGGPPQVIINEIRIDQPSTDNDEYFELKGDPGTSLDGMTYIVIGEGSGGNNGVIEAAVDLGGNTIGSSGLFVVAEASFTLGAADLTTNLNFENSDNVTHMLLFEFTGLDGDDLDAEDDCVLDSAPWTCILDSLALVEEENPPKGTECHYGPPSIGPDGTFVPGHVYRCTPDGTWTVGNFDFDGNDDGTPDGDDSPGAENPLCQGVCPWDISGDGEVGVPDLVDLILSWGKNAGHPADFDGSGDIGVPDLVEMILNWGPCPA